MLDSMFQQDAGRARVAEDRAPRGELAALRAGAPAPRRASSRGSRPRVRLGRLAYAWVIATALLAYGVVPAALAAAAAGGSSGENAFSELSRGGEGEEEASTKTKTSTTGSASSTKSGTSTGTVLVLGVGAAVVLLGGIAFVIMRDARSVAPVGDGPVTGRPARDPGVTLRKRRAKAKAARRQRKRNR
jgi:hypothetical protein